MKTVPDDYFQKGPFRRKGPFGFRTYTCTACHQRKATWEAFKAHRKVCSATHQPESPQAEDVRTLGELLRDMDEAS